MILGCDFLKRHIIAVFVVIAILVGCASASCAYIPGTEINPMASLYLDSYSVTLEPLGDGEMYIDMTVEGFSINFFTGA